MLKQTAKGASALYVLGTWVYGALYIWENQAGYTDFVSVAWHAFLRAVIWPVWIILDLM